jgi:hypothetical protein
MAIAAATETAIAVDTRVAAMPVERAVMPVRLAADMRAEHAVDTPVGHAVMRLLEAVQRPEADTVAAHAAGLVAAVMPVAASVAGTAVAAAMAAADTGK